MPRPTSIGTDAFLVSASVLVTSPPFARRGRFVVEPGGASITLRYSHRRRMHPASSN